MSQGRGLRDETPPGPDWRLAIFDFDGTLADTYPWFVAELDGLARRWHFRPVLEGEHAGLRRLDAQGVFRDRGVPGWKVPLIVADMRRRMARDVERIRLFEGVRPNRLVQEHLETYLALARAGDWDGQRVPASVERELRCYLPVWDPGLGFLSGPLPGLRLRSPGGLLLLSGVGDYPEYTGRRAVWGRMRVRFRRSRVLNAAEVLKIVSARAR